MVLGEQRTSAPPHSSVGAQFSNALFGGTRPERAFVFLGQCREGRAQSSRLFEPKSCIKL
jgi:hypothetical protein